MSKVSRKRTREYFYNFSTLHWNQSKWQLIFSQHTFSIRMKLSIAFDRPVMFLLFTWFLDAHTALPCLQTIKFYIKWRTTFSVATRNYNRENWSFDRNWQFQFLNCERPACSIVHMKLLEKLVVLLKLATITSGQGKFSYFSKFEIISLKHTERLHYRQLLKVLAVKVTWTIIVNEFEG